MKTETTKSSWKSIAIVMAEDILYARNITEQIVGDLPSTMRMVRLATKVSRKGFKP